MARPKTQINRRSDILEAAQVLFDVSFEKTTMDDIAKKAGISKGSLYLEFKNKDDILVSLVERHANACLDEVEAHKNEFNPPYLDFIREIYIKRILNAFDRSTSQKVSYSNMMTTSYRIKSELIHIQRRWLKMFAYMLEKAADNNEIRKFDDYEELAHCLNVCSTPFFPPYDLKYSPEHRMDLSIDELKQLIIKDVEMLLDVLWFGLACESRVELEVN